MNKIESVSPIFIFSNLRSGSTLLQRILATHEDISATGETFLLLPLFYALKSEGIYSEYEHEFASSAIREFCDSLPNGVKDYHEEIRDLTLRLYSKASKPGTRYFLEKTPSYHFIVDDILTVFHQAKFIFIWRHPLAVAASLLTSYGGKGRWVMYLYNQHIREGLLRLVAAYQNNVSHVHCLKYEDLILEPDKILQSIFSYLELPYSTELKIKFTELKLNKGDPHGIKYQTLSKEPLHKWKEVMTNPLRKAWCRHYLHSLGENSLKVMGYDLETILSEVHEIRPNFRYFGSDVVCMKLVGPITLLSQRKILINHTLESLRTKKPLYILH